jgi:hypothetical protein
MHLAGAAGKTQPPVKVAQRVIPPLVVQFAPSQPDHSIQAAREFFVRKRIYQTRGVSGTCLDCRLVAGEKRRHQ